MIPRPRLLFAVALSGAALVITTTAVSSQDTFRSSVDIVYVTATVTDGKGRAVGGLKQEDFSVLDDGGAQEILAFSAHRVPVSLGIVLDVSGSMTTPKLITARTAIERFMYDQLVAEDQLFLSAFALRTFLLQSWTANRDVLSAALNGVTTSLTSVGTTELTPISFGGGTAIYDAVRSALPVAETGEHRKKALLLVSDGDDTNSRTSINQLRELIRSSEVLVYALGVESDGERIAASRLRQITDPTGGRTEIVRGFANLDEATARLAAELSQQYLIGYAMPHEKDGQWHNITIGVKKKGATVRARAGYIG